MRVNSIQAVMLINLENTLSERCWSHESPFMQFYLYEMFRIGKSIELETRLLVAKVWERGK